MFTEHTGASRSNDLFEPASLTAAWYLSNPNVDHSAPPRPSKKKSSKKAPSKKPGKKGS